jgi:hypothetical protein
MTHSQTEKEIISRFGLPRDEMIAFRKTLREGADWVRVRTGDKPVQMCPVMFTEEGMTKVIAKFGIQIDAPAPADVWPKQATVTRTDYPNRRIMDVLIDGKTCRVVVHDSKMFYPGAEVKVDRKGGQLICSQRPDSHHKLFSAIRRKHEEQRKIQG